MGLRSSLDVYCSRIGKVATDKFCKCVIDRVYRFTKWVLFFDLQPLIVPNVDENIAAEIDDALLHEVDKEEMMRRVRFC